MEQLYLPLQQVIQETPDVKTFRFDLEGRPFDYLAGQHLFMDLDVKDPRGSRRPFTISSSPTEKGFISITTRIGSSPFKQRLNRLAIGERVKMKAPYGNFVLHPDLFQKAIFLAGGIGITPFRSMIKFAADERLPVSVTLLYSSRSFDQIAFRQEFEELACLNQNFKVIYTLTLEDGPHPNWRGLTGRIGAEMIRTNVSDIEKSVFYVCGPPAFYKAVSGILQSLSVASQNIKAEEFTGY